MRPNRSTALLAIAISVFVVPVQPVLAIAEDTAGFDVPAPDQSDWSNARREGYEAIDPSEFGTPRAVLRIPTLDIAVAVYGDTKPTTLDAGVGWVEGTAELGTTGNAAVAGHRDGFFRPLENIAVGTTVMMLTTEQELTYEVTSISVVDPLDTSVLDPTPTPQLTLITCHPFRYKGYAPDRFIVQAKLVDSDSKWTRTPADGPNLTSNHQSTAP